jgi:hypothetical protein
MRLRVRYWEESGRASVRPSRQLMTESGHPSGECARPHSLRASESVQMSGCCKKPNRGCRSHATFLRPGPAHKLVATPDKLLGLNSRVGSASASDHLFRRDARLHAHKKSPGIVARAEPFSSEQTTSLS